MVLTELFTQIANSIRAKNNTTEKIIASDFPKEIEKIDTSIAEEIYIEGKLVALQYKGRRYITENRYTELQYLESNAQQYINTRYRHTANTKIEIKFRQSSSNIESYVALCGARRGSYLYEAFAFFTRFNGNKFCFCRSGNEKDETAIYDKDIMLTMNGLLAEYTDGTNSYSIESTGTNNAGVCDFLLFNVNTSTAGAVKLDSTNTSGLRIYYCKIYENDVLVKDFIPVKDIFTGKIGMLDRVNEQLYTNAGTGEFTYE